MATSRSNEQLRKALRDAKLAADRVASEFKISALSELSHLRDPKSFSKVTNDIVDLLLHTHQITNSRQELERISGLSEEEFLKEIPSEFRKFYNAQLAPSIKVLVQLHLKAYVRQAHTTATEVEKHLGPLTLVSNGRARNQRERADLFELLGKLPNPIDEFDALRADFPSCDFQALETLLEGEAWWTQYIRSWPQIATLRGSLAADDGTPFDEVWDDQNHPAHQNLFDSYSHYQSLQRAMFGYATKKLLIKLKKLFSDDVSPDADWTTIRGSLRFSTDYLADSIERLGVDREPGWTDRERAALDKAIDFLGDEDIWHFLRHAQSQNAGDWLRNLKDLDPVVVEERFLNSEKRQLVVEIYRSFVFENYLAVAALTRAFIERIVKERAKAFGVDSTERRNGKVQDKSLESLIDEVGTKDDVVHKHTGLLDKIRRTANKALHEPRRKLDDIERSRYLHQQRMDALEFIKGLRLLLSDLEK